MAHAMNLLGERWALLIVRDLLLGPKRFSDLQAGLPGAGPNVLSQRLRELRESGIIRRRTLPPPAASQVYELTPWGAELDPIVTALGLWGSRSPVVPPAGGIRADSLMLSVRSLPFTRAGRDPWSADYEIRLGPDRFTASVADGALVRVVRGEPFDAPAAVISAEPEDFAEVLDRRTSARDAVADGRLELDGDPDAAWRFLDALAL